MFELGADIVGPTLFDSGLSSNLTTSSNSDIDHSSSSGSPPNLFSTNLDRPSWLFNTNSLYGTGTSPTDALSSLLDPFAVTSPFGVAPTETSSPLMTSSNHLNSATADRPTAFNVGQLTGVPYKQIDRSTSNSSSARNNAYSNNMFNEFSNPLGAPGTPIGSSMSPAIGSFGATTPTMTSSNGNVPPPKNPKLYKTELCRSWMDHGRCNYGERCQYAHGEAEKRPIPRHPKYKTEACQSFHQSGYCPYGPRCHFIHNETELLSQQQPRQVASQLSSPVGNDTNSNMFVSSNRPSQNVTGVPSSVLQRVYSLPGYGSAAESPAGSSNDSGSESPNGSFSPGLDLDENGPFTSGFLSASLQKTRSQQPAQRFLSYDQSKTLEETQFSGLLNGVMSWSLDDNSAGKWEESRGRLPVFAQLSNPQ